MLEGCDKGFDCFQQVAGHFRQSQISRVRRPGRKSPSCNRFREVNSRGDFWSIPRIMQVCGLSLGDFGDVAGRRDAARNRTAVSLVIMERAKGFEPSTPTLASEVAAAKYLIPLACFHAFGCPK